MGERSWPSPSSLAAGLSLPAGVRVRQLARPELPGALAALAAWAPELELLDPALLTPGFYDELAAFAGEDPSPDRRPVFALTLEDDDGPLAYLILECELPDFLVYEIGEGTLALRASVVRPRQPAAEALERGLVELALRVARATSGVHFLSCYLALDDRPACARLERAGFRPWAVLPNGGLVRRGDAVLHQPQALWLAPLFEASALRWPDPDKLRPRTAALVELLTGRGEAATPSESPKAAMPKLDPALATRPGGRDSWPDIGALAASLALPPGVVVRQLARSDLPEVLARLPVWHPALLHSAVDFLSPESYERVALAGEEARVDRRPGFALLAELDGELAVFASYTFTGGRSRRLRAELAVVNPDHRRKQLSNHLTPLWVLLARALEADTILGWATLAHPYTQLACERQGLDLVGVLPTEYEVDGQGETSVVFEALYAASLVPADRYLCPPREALAEPVAALAAFVLGERLTRSG